MAIGYVQRRVIPGYVAFEFSSYSPAANVTALPINVVRLNGVDGEFTVTISAEDGSGVNGVDYTFVSQEVTFADQDAGPEVITVTLAPQYASAKDFDLVLSDVFIGTIGSPDATTVTLEPFGSVALDDTSYSVAQGGTVLVGVERSGSYSGAVTVSWSTDITGASPSSGSVAWTDTESTAKSITFDLDDADDDGNITIAISSTDGTTLGTPSTAPIDVIRHGVLSFFTSSYDIMDNDGSVAITVTRTGGSDGAVTVDYATQDDTAIAGEDYTAASNTLSWADGEDGAKVLYVTILPDSPSGEEPEDFLVNLSNATGGASIGTDTTTVTITTTEPIGGASLAIVMDRSQSLTLSELEDEKAACIQAINALDSDDEAAFFTLDEDTTLIQDFTTNKTSLINAVNSQNTLVFGTDLMDAIWDAAITLSSRNSRKAILLMTDGQDGSSVHTQAEAIAKANEVQAPVYILGFSDGINVTSLDAIATQTGGQFIPTPSSQELEDFIQDLVDQIT